jgi:lycopene beta-cyclase
LAAVQTAEASVTARWVLDSRPSAPARPSRTAWLQHFRGWFVTFDDDALDPEVPVLLDFTPEQPEGGVAFGYVLPLDARRALVEYTQFSRGRLPSEQYDAELRGYLGERFGARAAAARVDAVEDGAIPMTDAVHARRVGRRVFRIGTAGGATRPSTGYTFAAMQRQGAAIAAALLDGAVPEPPRPYPLRHRWMDSVLLRALDSGHACGADLLFGLFERNPPERVLRFLDGGTTPLEDLAIMRASPLVAMTRATAQDAAVRLARRVSSLPRAGRRRSAGRRSASSSARG